VIAARQEKRNSPAFALELAMRLLFASGVLTPKEAYLRGLTAANAKLATAVNDV